MTAQLFNSHIPSLRMFNMGFHNAANDAENNRDRKWVSSPHPRPEYQVGYDAGYAGKQAAQDAWDLALLWGDVEISVKMPPMPQ